MRDAWMSVPAPEGVVRTKKKLIKPKPAKKK
jgi:hypothetical protein